MIISMKPKTRSILYLELRTGYDPALLVSRADPLVVTAVPGVKGILPLPAPCQRCISECPPSRLLSAEPALVLLMWDGMTHVNGITADRDKGFHYRVRNTVTKMKMNKCFIKA